MMSLPQFVVRFLGIFSLLLLWLATDAAARDSPGVTYDGRSLIINGKRDIFFSGSIHYARSTPEVWPQLITKAKKGGLNVIETYVFWNVHETLEGQYNFEGRYDLVKFMKLIQENGLYATLRIGPFIQAEWNHGGFPFWLRQVQNITFRTDNPPFMNYMEKWVRLVVDKMKGEKLFASQGGPIILAQIENEYDMVGPAFGPGATRYIDWAASMAVSTGAGVPWIMCKQKIVPAAVIPACNGRNCGDINRGADYPDKPDLWAENWTAQYRVFGDPPSQRSAEDLAYSVARYFSKNGTLVNYYMYHGGTNFGRTGASFVMTRYYDEAPLDEFGLFKEPKWGHLRDLHHALRLCKKALLYGTPTVQIMGSGHEALVFENQGKKLCAAFLTNTITRIDATVSFRGVDFFLPRRSISILPDCKTVVFNTQMVNSQHNARTYTAYKEANTNNQWQMFQERIPKRSKKDINFREPMELFNMTKDTTDYLWYTTNFRLEDYDLPMRADIRPVLEVSNLGDAMHAFVNNKYIGSGHGAKSAKSFIFKKAMALKRGLNRITILAMTVGMPDNGAFLEHRYAGVHTVSVQGLNTGTLDLSYNGWGHQVGMQGEKLGISTEKGSKAVNWVPAQPSLPVTWYKSYFDAPRGNDPVALDLGSMGKGLAWVNGEGIGRYWVSYLNPLGKPSQAMYHVPRSFLKPKGNLIVLFEEEGGDPTKIVVTSVRRDNICTFISEFNPPRVRSFARKDDRFQTVGNGDTTPIARLECDGGKVMKSIAFASFGNPTGMCGNYTAGTCHSQLAKSVVEKACLGKNTCVLTVSHEVYGADIKCPGTTGTLAVQAKCSRKPNKASE